MKAKLVTIIALFFSLLSVALLWKPWQTSLKLKGEIAANRAELQTTNATLQEQTANLDRLREQSAALKQEAAALRNKKQTPGTNPKSDRRVENAPADANKGREEFIRRTLEDPEMKESFRQFQIAKLQNVYSDLFRDLDLSPDQAAEFLDLMLSQQERDMADVARFLNGDQNSEPSSFTKEATDREVKALLGQDAFEKFEAFDKTTTERLGLSEVREKLLRTDTPLDDNQADDLLRIMMEEREHTPLTAFDPRNPDTSRNKLVAIAQGDNAQRFYDAQIDLNRRILGRAGTVLTPEQYEALETFLNQYLQVQKISIEMARQAAERNSDRH